MLSFSSIFQRGVNKLSYPFYIPLPQHPPIMHSFLLSDPFLLLILCYLKIHETIEKRSVLFTTD